MSSISIDSGTDLGLVVCDLYTEAAAAVTVLQRAGFDVRKIAVVGVDFERRGRVESFVGVPKDPVLRYENALKANELLLVMQDDAHEINLASQLLKASGLSMLEIHRLRTAILVQAPTETAVHEARASITR